MLHLNALPIGTLDLLRRLSSHPLLEQFALVGGTSLALRFGHRRSIDFDFFTPATFDVEWVAHTLQQDFVGLEITGINQTGFNTFIEDLKIDFVTYRYPLIELPEIIEGIRMFSLPDVIGMKLAAITNRGAKKDFYDLFILIKSFGVDALIDIYRQKYPNHDPMIVLRSMIFFDDAEDEEAPELLIEITWDEIKNFISTSIKESPLLKP